MSGMSSGDIFAMQLTPEFLVRCAAMDDIALGARAEGHEVLTG